MSDVPSKAASGDIGGTLGAARDKKGASGYAKQTVVGFIMQALVDKEVVEHKSVVLWRENPTETATAFDHCRLEMFFGSMVFKPVRTQRRPPGTDRVLNWAAYGLWEDQLSHVLSDKEAADKKKLQAAANRRYETSEGGKETRRQYAASEGGKENQRRRQGERDDIGNKRARLLLETFDNSSRPAVQQKTNEPQMGCLAALLGESY
jgi:hypothetical protein